MIWNTLGAFFGSLIATGIVARFTQKWIEHRERRHRRDELRLELYLEVVDLVPHNEVVIAELSGESASTPIELQQKRLRNRASPEIARLTGSQGSLRQLQSPGV